jgi:hypothetical protein
VLWFNDWILGIEVCLPFHHVCWPGQLLEQDGVHKKRGSSWTYVYVLNNHYVR